MATRERLGLPPDALPRWSLPIIGHIQGDWTRFTDLRESLRPVTPRALSLNLQQMIGGQLVIRRLEDRFPPAALYGLAPLGRKLLSCLAA
jgi:DNA-binding HxlR family transcriptional regulator